MTIHQRYPAGHPRGHLPAAEHAQRLRDEGQADADFVMDPKTDTFLVVTGRTPKEK